MTMKPSLAGLKFGRLLVSHREGEGKRHKWVCQCDCGRLKRVTYTCLVNGGTKSCGCLRKETAARLGRSHAKPGRRTVEYRTWIAIKGRCYNPNHQDFPDYGGRGVRVSDDWLCSYEQFLHDMGRRPEGTSIDRIDVNGGYSADNCRWSTLETQMNNRRNTSYLEHEGLRLPLGEWTKRVGINKACIVQRLNHGWSTADALSTEVRFRSPNGVRRQQ